MAAVIAAILAGYSAVVTNATLKKPLNMTIAYSKIML